MKKKLLAEVAVGVFFLGMIGSARATPYTGADIEFSGNEFSDFSGWYVKGQSLGWLQTADDAIFTYWSGKWVEYEAELTEGNWNIGLNIINHGNLGVEDWYCYFEVNNGLETFSIAASDMEVNNGFFNLDVTSADVGMYTVRYTWVNDQYAPQDGLDANIQVNSVFFDNTNTVPVPEPATILLLGTGLVGLLGAKKKRLSKKRSL